MFSPWIPVYLQHWMFDVQQQSADNYMWVFRDKIDDGASHLQIYLT
jgi:hypothetical protein